MAWGLAHLDSRELVEWGIYFEVLNEEADAAREGEEPDDWRDHQGQMVDEGSADEDDEEDEEDED